MPLPIRDNQDIKGLRTFAKPGSLIYRAYYAQKRRKDRKKENET